MVKHGSHWSCFTIAGLLTASLVVSIVPAFGQVEAKKAATADTNATTDPPSEPAGPTPAGEKAAEKAEQSLLAFIYESEGIFFFPQLILSFVLVGLVITAVFEMRRAKFVPLAYVDNVVQLVAEKKFKEAYDVTVNEKSFVGVIMLAGMNNLSRGLPEAQQSMDDAGTEMSIKHEERLAWLALLANVGTMVGLLGTVWGMVAAFMVIARSDVAPKPSELAQGVSQALITTVWGLLQAIPAVFFHTFFRNRMIKFVIESELVSKQVVSRIPVPGRKTPTSMSSTMSAT